MARKLKILEKYAELVELVERWVIYELKSSTSGLGYPSQSYQFVYRPTTSGHVDPTGYSAGDHRAVAQALESLSQTDPDLWAAVKMYYMPWTIPALQAGGYPFAPCQTYYDRLTRAHAWLQSEWRTNLTAMQNAAKSYADGLT